LIFERHPWLEEIRPRIEAIAAADADVLIRGARPECEIVARAIHAVSGLPRRSFTGVSCGLYSPRALESTLLSSVPRSGLLYLGEIEEIPLALQARFLQALRDHRPSRVEGRAPWPSRVIAATNRDLEELVRRGEFVEELYRLLEAEELTIPPNAEIPKTPREYDEMWELGFYLFWYGRGELAVDEYLAIRDTIREVKGMPGSPEEFDPWHDTPLTPHRQRFLEGCRRLNEAYRRAGERVRQERPNLSGFVNCCPRCGKIARTSRARQCRWCHHDWHDQPTADT